MKYVQQLKMGIMELKVFIQQRKLKIEEKATYKMWEQSAPYLPCKLTAKHTFKSEVFLNLMVFAGGHRVDLDTQRKSKDEGK